MAGDITTATKQGRQIWMRSLSVLCCLISSIWFLKVDHNSYYKVTGTCVTVLVKTTVRIHNTSYILSILPNRLIDTKFNKCDTLHNYILNNDSWSLCSVSLCHVSIFLLWCELLGQVSWCLISWFLIKKCCFLWAFWSWSSPNLS